MIKTMQDKFKNNIRNSFEIKKLVGSIEPFTQEDIDNGEITLEQIKRYKILWEKTKIDIENILQLKVNEEDFILGLS